MQNLFAQQVEMFLRSKNRRQAWLVVFLCLALVVSIGTSLLFSHRSIAMTNPGRTLTCKVNAHFHDASCYSAAGELICHQADYLVHSHNEYCYDENGQLICPLPEMGVHFHDASCYTEERIPICGMEEGEGGHEHSEECYEVRSVLTCTEQTLHSHDASCYDEGGNLVCGQLQLTAHAHSDACFTTNEPDHSFVGDPNADVETEAEWTAAFASIPLTEQWNEDLLNIARSQLGYRESNRNCMMADGVQKGYTRYGDWAGSPYGDWSAMFVSFCLHYAGIPLGSFPCDNDIQTWLETLQARGQYGEKGSYQPKPGDLVFFELDYAPGADHMGIVSAADGEQLEVIEGNCDDAVALTRRSLSDTSVLGFGILPDESSVRSSTILRFEDTAGDVTVIVEAESGAFPEGTTMKVSPVESESVADAVSGAVDSSVGRMQAVDISFYDAEGNEIEPQRPIRVYMRSVMIGETDEAVVVHVDNEGSASVVEKAASGKAEVVFDSDSFSVYVIVETVIEKTVLASDGLNYNVTVSCGTDSGIPKDADLDVVELVEGSADYDAYVTNTESVLGLEEGSAAYIRLFDIKILDQGGEKIQPADGTTVDVRIELADMKMAEESSSTTQVVHFADGEVNGQVIENTVKPEELGASVSFAAESFSVYAVVDAPEPVSFEDAATTLVDLTSERGEGGFLLSIKRGSTTNNYYMTSNLKSNGTFQETTDRGEADIWYFEAVEGTSDQFRIYTMSGSAKQYLARDLSGNNINNVKLSDSGDVFQISRDNNGFYIKLASEGRWLQHSGSGDGIRLYTDKKNAGNSLFTFSFISPPGEADPYKLNGQIFGIMNRKNSTSAYGMMAEEKNVGSGIRLNAKEAFIRTDPMDQSHLLYVAKDSDIPMWTFEIIEKDIYYLKTDGQYLRIEGSNVTLADSPDEYCRIQVIPGTGSNTGKVRLQGERSGTAVNLPRDNNGFYASTDNSGNAWHNLMEHSVYSEEDFVEYKAQKVSVSDNTNVANGKQVVIYTRVWNDVDKKYEFYAVDHNGDLVPCYESGDSLVWIGAQNNTLLWDFTEYYTPGTTRPSGYYELKNTYTGQYFAPQISGGQIFSNEPIGVNLNGRRYGDYYTAILAWDDAHYDYAGYKTENGKIVSCPMAEADTFYFAVLDKEEGTLTPVNTVDHEAHGITMRMIDCPNRTYMGDILGNNEGGVGNTLHQGLLSSYIDGDHTGYPTTLAGNSLGSMYNGATPVNHLFIQSILDGSGYYQFDSSENFAHLNGNEFEVYQELGSVKGTVNTHTHGQFMPYNTLDPNTVHADNPYNLTDIYGRPLSDNNPRKYENLYSYEEADNSHFALELTGHFSQPPNGKDAWGNDIIFEFVGDDDFWLYVDGELVIDLGGIHSAVPGSVNYSTGDVYVNGTHTTIRDLFYNNYMGRGHSAAEAQAYVDGIFEEKIVNGQTCSVFKDYSAHTIRIFYMERGAGASNLRMRFNLATVTPGEVVLNKEILGTVKQDFASMKFPFQIYYKTAGDEAYRLIQQEMTSGEEPRWRVTQHNSSAKVEYAESVSIDGVTYEDVFYLKPGQSASIMMPDDTVSYYIRECGVDTSIYNEVKVNDVSVEGVTPDGARTTKCFETSKTSIEDRARVNFGNQVDPSQLRTLNITKRLFDESGSELTTQQDPTGFTMRLFLGDDLDYYNQGEYYVKDAAGEYCYYDADAGAFRSIGTNDLETLSEEQLNQVTFRTSPSGAASKLPAGHSIEIRGLMVGTRFQVKEEDYEIPVGYGKRTWTEYADDKETSYTGYKRVEGSYLVEEGDTQNSGMIRDNSNPKIEVHNQRGWGIRAEKTWSDQSFMRSHEDTFFAVYVNDSLLEGTVRRIDSYNYTTYFFASLQEGAEFTDYKVYEVRLTDPQVADDGTVSYSDIEKIEPDGSILLGGIDKDGAELSDLEYKVSYAQGPVSSGQGGVGATRTDTVTNTRTGGLQIVKTDWTGTGLPGAEFDLKQDDALYDSYVSDSRGQVTTAYLEDGTYTLTETKAPAQYCGLASDLTITVSEESYTVSGGDEDAYDYDPDTAVLTIKNRPFTLKAVKQDTAGIPLSGAEFALYKQIMTSSGLRRDYYPMPGCSSLITDADGIIPRIDEMLAPGTYYLSEIKPPRGYDPLAEDLCFTVGKDGRISIETEAYRSWLSTEQNTATGELDHTITVLNGKMQKISIWKTDPDGKCITTGASFALYRMDDYDDAQQKPKENATPILTGTTDTRGLLSLGSLPPGEYRLMETEAPKGYYLLDSAIEIRINAQNVTAFQDGNAALIVQKGHENWVSGQDEETLQIRVWNSPGVVMPSTGGHGINTTALCGLLLTSFAFAGLIVSRRRRSEA